MCYTTAGNAAGCICYQHHMLTVDDNAPQDVVITDQDGEDASLADLRGSWVVVFFYPRDNTPGCTTEVCSFRDSIEPLKKAGAVVIGVSKDSEKSHQKFIEKQSLNFPLWADPEHKLMEAFGTWQLKKFMGREYMGTTRSTFLIDPSGKIVHVWEKVKPAGHAEDVLAVLQAQ